MIRAFVLTILVATLPHGSALGAVSFFEVPTALVDVAAGDVDWVDIDNDGDLDVFIAGEIAPSTDVCVTRIYENQGGTFVQRQEIAPGVCFGDGDWADYDHDGDVDLVYTGSNDVERSILFRNDGGTLVEIQELCSPGIGSIRWMDLYGNDRPDIVAATTGGLCTMSFDGSFYTTSLQVPEIVNLGDIAIADVDGNGLDWIAYSGRQSGSSFLEVVGPDIEQSLNGVQASSLAFGDLDNDGHQDLVSSGQLDDGQNLSQFWLYSEPNFIGSQLGHSVSNGDVALGDADNDGDLDIALFGEDSVRPAGEIHLNNGSGFEIGTVLVRMTKSSVSWGDYDNDGDLDLIAIGLDEMGQHRTRLFRNDSFLTNTPPTVPTGLHSTPEAHTLTLGWTDANDLETPFLGLTYDLRVGSSPGAGDIRSAQALADGTPLLPAMGTVAQPHDLLSHLDVTHIPGGDVYWTVQAADASFARSGFATEQHIFLPYLEQRDLGSWRFPTFQWADMDDDRELEVVVSGGLDDMNLGYDPLTSLIQDDFTTSTIDFGSGNIDVGDYDNDGDLDLVVAGLASNKTPSSNGNFLFENDNGGFAPVSVGLPTSLGSGERTVDWGDYDNDGDLDLLFSAFGIYQNEGGTFVARGLIPVLEGYARFGDYDRDGDLDILAGDALEHRIYRNDGEDVFTPLQQFADVGTKKTGTWIDIDTDGYLDFVASSNGGQFPCLVYEYQNGTFVFDPTNTAVFDRMFNWEPSVGDLDHDGDTDLVVGGGGFVCPPDQAVIYRNDQGVFTRRPEPLPACVGGSAVADFDHDGDLDVLLGGVESVLGSAPLIRNNEQQVNAAPSVPTSLTFILNGTDLYLTWAPSSDDRTPSNGITYNVRVGTTAGGQEIVAAMSHLDTGQRKLAQPGNAGGFPVKRLDVSNITAPRLYWSVQSVDGAYVGSMFAAESEVELQPTAAPLADESTVFLGASPNPFSQRTQLAFRLARPAMVDLKLYDLRGRRVRDLIHETFGAGTHAIAWNGRDNHGQSVAAGSYLAQLRVDGVEQRRRVTISR